MTRIETHRLAIVARSKCLHIVKLLMFLFVLAKLLLERHNLYGNSLDFKLNICKKKWPSSISDPILDIHQEIIGTNIVMRDEIHSFELSRQLN